MLDNLNMNFFNSIILAGIAHGIIFSSVLFLKKSLYSKTNFYLGYTVLALTFSNLQYWLKDVGLYPETYNLIFIPFEFLMLPFFYLFVKSYLKKKTSNLGIVYLFIPFLLTIIYQPLGNLAGFNIRIIEIFNLIIEYISILFSILIITVVFRLIYRYEKDNADYNISNVKIKTDWLKRTLFLGLALCTLWFLSLNLFDNLFSEGYYQYYPLWIGIAILIYWVGYSAIFQSNIFKERTLIRETLVNDMGIVTLKKTPTSFKIFRKNK